MSKKTFGNTDASGAKKNVKDIKFWGNGDTFKLISKAWSEEEGWMKSTKAMEIENIGCVVQVTTQQLNDSAMWPTANEGEPPIVFDSQNTIKHSVIAEALTFVPGVWIKEEFDAGEKVIGRRLISFSQE